MCGIELADLAYLEPFQVACFANLYNFSVLCVE
jgi:hypothetical protein